jgi:thiamine biosynthesis protein ThiS
MKVEINGFMETVPDDASVSDLIERFGEQDVDLIVEYNGRFLYPQKWPTTFVSTNDSIEFIHPNFGG